MSSEPLLQTAALEAVGYGIPLDAGTDEHHYAREQCGEAHTHLIEDDSGKNQEEDENVEEGFRTLHRTEGSRVPAAGREHQVFDRRKDVHEDVGTEHGKRQEEEHGPAYTG